MRFFDSASQKQLSEAQSKALSARFNTALEASLQAWQQKHHAVILVSPAVVQGGTGYHPGNPAGYCPANEGGAMRCRGADCPADMGGRVWPPPILVPGAICGR